MNSILGGIMKWVIMIAICFLGGTVNGIVDLGSFRYLFGFVIGTICQSVLILDF